MNCAGDGVRVTNSQNICIGQYGCGVNIAGSGKHGIYILGDETKHVHVESSMIMDSGDRGNIEIAAGDDIWIGGSNANQRNNIEFQSNGVGVLVHGQNTNAYIINN